MLLTILLVSCSKPAPPAKETVADSTPAVATRAPKDCGVTSSPVLTGDGVGQFRIGSTVEELRKSCEVVQDTSLEHGNEGLPERRVGVLIENDTLEATVNDGRVWRIEVGSPRVRTEDDLGVGTSVATLRDLPNQYLGYGEGGPFVKITKHCGLSFEISRFKGFAKTFADVPATASVERILVLGCDRNEH